MLVSNAARVTLAIIFAIGFGVGGCGGALQFRMHPLAFRPYDSFFAIGTLTLAIRPALGWAVGRAAI